MRSILSAALCGLAFFLGASAFAADGDILRVGSKRFTESYVLGEVLTQAAGKAEHKQGLGNTAIVLAALQAGSIDVYPEYLGTIDLEILKNPKPTSLPAMREALAKMGLGVGVPLGFNNTYALAVRGDAPASLATLTDLAQARTLALGLSHEFIGRADGWPGLAARYKLPQQPRGLDHGIAYEALAQRQVDVIDVYSTDAKIGRNGLRVLRDDLAYFPRYDAVLLYRLDAPRRFPQQWQAIAALEGRITEADMIAMNAAVEIDGKSFAAVAAGWLGSAPRAAARSGLRERLFAPDLGRLTRQHITLVLVALAVASAIGIPLGLVAAFAPRLRQIVFALAGVLQTVPSLALLAMLIPLLGMIGAVPAMVALCVYALLPIVRNTCTGLLQVPQGLRMAALALGLTWRQRLLQVELPLALPVILAGVKTAAVMSVGTATIAAFIGAGGYGERITIGLALNDNAMLLAGAIPAALLALATQALFEWAEWLVRPKV